MPKCSAKNKLSISGPKMGLFKRKTPKLSTYDGKTNGSQTSRSYLLMIPTSNPGRQNQLKGGFGSITPTMSLPSIPIPDPPDPASDPAGYLRSIHSVRERSRLVMKRATLNQLNHFDVNMDMFQNTADYVVSIIKVLKMPSPLVASFNLLNIFKRDFADNFQSIPPHGRWQHFDVGGRPRVDQLLQSWPSTVDPQERARRLIDLFTVSVLLDAGAGNQWSYKSKESGKVFRRSEGLAVASLEMFKTGAFSSDPAESHKVDRIGLKKITVKSLERGLQVSEDNPLAGLEGRAGLLTRLSDALANTELFGSEGRPGNMIGMSTGGCLLLTAPLTCCRLSPVASFNAGSVGSNCPSSNSLGSTNGWLGSHLAFLENSA